MSRVAVALSGGVDSAVSAMRLLDAGHEVAGVHFRLWRPPRVEGGVDPLAAIEADARAIADQLGIALSVWDFTDAFDAVLKDFVDEYAAGRTPNPCLRCNTMIKWGVVLDRALSEGFSHLAMGHYARLVTRPDGVVELHRAHDKAKDQSYVLSVMTQPQLRHALFPLGDSLKSEVRAEAAARGLTVASKPDSSDLCFIPDGDTAGWLHRRLGSRPGPIVDETGREVGGHDGTFTLTIGQRRGLRLGRPAADGQPRYVTALDPGQATVTVGPREALRVTRLTAADPRWCEAAPPTGESFDALVQVRAHGAALQAQVRLVEPSLLAVDFLSPLYGVAPGQTAVLYDGDRVLGSATIVAALPRVASHGSRA
ncbi:MAG: tRNA 2-thiouridine(34) synthase MnmA [Propionibacteriaceae bacterium]|jgi:tRNA-specific 2-thiouridylase|nr:tRNA 2-thiouridine(34) synthase MnmA [Propionibacteriaceae bacterium]